MPGEGQRSQAYLDFELQISEGAGREYPVAVLRSPAGEAEDTLHFPYGDLELENCLLKLQNVLLRSGGVRRQALNDEEQAVQDFGQELFSALFAGEIRSRYDFSLAQAIEQGKGLRVKLRIQAPELTSLPWEFMYDPNQGEYVCLCADTPIVRYLQLPRPPRPITVSPPLRILGMVASPKDLEALNVNREKQRVEAAVLPLKNRGLVELEWLVGQTWQDLQRAMRRGPWHVFHFIGHGGFDRLTDEGLVAFADEKGRARFLSATGLGRLLADHRSLRLVLLNACEGASGGKRDIFSSTASILMRRGIPAVLAMQYEITDRAAVELARAFYEALADGLPVDGAVTEARKAISLAVNNTMEWGTPVLHLRAPDGVVFDLKREAAPGRDTLALEKPARAGDDVHIDVSVSGQGQVGDIIGIQRGDTVDLKPDAPQKFPVSSKLEPASVKLALDVDPSPVNVGEEVYWIVGALNSGYDPTKDLTLVRGRTLLTDETFNLAADEKREFTFVETYQEAGEYTEIVRLFGPGVSEQASAAVLVRQPPSLALGISAEPQEVKPGEEVAWQVSVTNDGGEDLHQVMVQRGRTLLEDPFDLPAGEEQRFSFTKTYQEAGEQAEKVTAVGMTAGGERVGEQAQGSVQVKPLRPDVLTITEPIHMELVRVPAGEFLMGSDLARDKGAYDDEQPQHRIHVDEFYIGKHPVTNAQYAAFAKASGEEWEKPSGKDNHPAVEVTWHDALAFCKWLSEETDRAFCLPSEAEWEKAARGTDGYIYPWGDEWDQAKCNIKEGGPGDTTPVGHYSPAGDSPYGCVDMAGNVWEWTRSINKDYPYNPADGREDLNADGARVLRGGSWIDPSGYASCAARGGNYPHYWGNSRGFRVMVQSLAGSES